jgi:hypothetical protein
MEFRSGEKLSRGAYTRGKANEERLANIFNPLEKTPNEPHRQHNRKTDRLR